MQRLTLYEAERSYPSQLDGVLPTKLTTDTQTKKNDRKDEALTKTF